MPRLEPAASAPARTSRGGSPSDWIARRFRAFFSLRPRRLRAWPELGLCSVGESVSIGRSPAIRDVETLARKHGFRALLCLNEEGEPGQDLSPNVEASWAHVHAMQHQRVSFDTSLASTARVDAFLACLRTIAKPVYVHSAHGHRAAALLTIHLGVERGLSGRQALTAAEAMGFPRLMEPLRAFTVLQVDERTGARSRTTAP